MLARAVFEKLPALRHDRGIWNTILSSSERGDLTLAPDSIRSDRELMLLACSKKNGFPIIDVDESLLLDEDFIRQVIATTPTALNYLPHVSQLRFPNIIFENIEKMCDCRPNYFIKNVAPDILASRSFAEAWFKAGGAFYDGYFPESLKDDKDIFHLSIDCQTHFFI